MRVRINIFAVCALLLIFYLESALSTLILLSAALLHECGHFLAMKMSDGKVKRVDIEPLGATIVFDSAKVGYRAELVTALGGPLAGIFCAAVGWLCFLYFPSPLLLLFILASLVFSLINLVPISTLDGGVALRAILLQRMELDKAEPILHAASLISALVLFALSILLLRASGYNISLLALTAFQLVILFGNIISNG